MGTRLEIWVGQATWNWRLNELDLDIQWMDCWIGRAVGLDAAGGFQQAAGLDWIGLERRLDSTWLDLNSQSFGCGPDVDEQMG